MEEKGTHTYVHTHMHTHTQNNNTNVCFRAVGPGILNSVVRKSRKDVSLGCWQ